MKETKIKEVDGVGNRVDDEDETLTTLEQVDLYHRNHNAAIGMDSEYLELLDIRPDAAEIVVPRIAYCENCGGKFGVTHNTNSDCL
ncbi:hypothetical protein DSL72_001142 [Monilinia vaccinii-corymbosi]|uniref:Uncharacterized protein n=1 Tax=Monilinia vaccinii-corymbosi TaxID=61207 RepID=A0A8A3P106_9HELO|nr:hypothetical protein DSL72_001142 [Monilinia vaccinii-corymbosi]